MYKENINEQSLNNKKTEENNEIRQTQDSVKPVSNKTESLKIIAKFWQWTGFGDKNLWDLMQLLLIPLSLSFVSYEFQDTSKKQEAIRDYFKEVSSLVFDKQKLENIKAAKEFDPQRELLSSKTLVTLEILGTDTKLKSQVIRFIGNASLSKYIPIRRGDLAETDLSYVDLIHADLQLTNLKKANLSGAFLCGANLDGANLNGANLNKARYDSSTIFSKEQLSKNQLESMQKSSCHN